MWDFHHVYKEHIAKGGFLTWAGFSDRNTGTIKNADMQENMWITRTSKNQIKGLIDVALHRIQIALPEVFVQLVQLEFTGERMTLEAALVSCQRGGEGGCQSIKYQLRVFSSVMLWSVFFYMYNTIRFTQFQIFFF